MHVRCVILLFRGAKSSKFSGLSVMHQVLSCLRKISPTILICHGINWVAD